MFWYKSQKVDKKTLRKHYSDLRAKLSSQEMDSMSLAIANRLIELPVWKAQYYHLFLPIEQKNEINTEYILSIIQGKDKEVVVPKVIGAELKHYLLLDSTSLVVNKWGIPEPVDGIEIDPKIIDVVFVPLLAFDKQGHRIGYGKGMYDGFLAQCRDDVLKIGLSFFDAEEQFEEVFSSDIPLNCCITPDRIYKF